MKCITPHETGFSIWVSDLVAVETLRQQEAQEVSAAESAHIPCSRSLMEAPHRHAEHEIITVVSGAGRLTWDGGDDLQATTGQILLVPGGLTHLLQVDHHITLRGLYVHPVLCHALAGSGVPDPMAAQLAQTGSPLAPRVVADAQLFRSLQELFEQCQAEYAHDTPWRTVCLRTIGQLVAIALVRLMQLDDHTLHADPAALRVLSVKAWMDRHFLDQIKLPELAQMAHLSLSQFSALFRQLFDTSPKAYIIQRRLERAASLLAQTELSVTEIAAGVGFDHLAHFGRLFREHTGLNPSAYRKKHQIVRQYLLA